MNGLVLRRAWAAALSVGIVCVTVLAGARVLGARTPHPDLAAVFGAPPCTAPCWRGITPGETLLGVAFERIERNPDVDSLVVNVRSATWAWNGAQPAAFAETPRAFDGRLLFDDSGAPEKPVQGMAVMTTLTLGDITLARGAPLAHHLFLPPGEARPGAVYAAVYTDATIFAALTCPVSAASFWSAPVGVSFGEVDLSLGGETMSTPGTLPSPVAWAAAACEG